MTVLPDFSLYGYQVIEQLNQNFQGGRMTYKAFEIATQKLVVIKQFRFLTSLSWDSYKEIEREIEVLQSLEHFGIPQYLEQFEGDGLCLVQEYKNAQPLSKFRSLSHDELKNIAIQLLEILVYLQEKIPPIFHKDIKPENVLVDDNINVYLIDFGLARIGNNTMALSSISGGTFGFMPPEQLHNQKLTFASDLYGLGATLICLITHIKSYEIGCLVDFSTNKIIFKDKVSQFSFRFIQWLEKMVEPLPAKRYQNAKLALEALKPIDVIRIPEINLDKLELNFVAKSDEKKLSQTIRVTNTILDTILQGEWLVSHHPSDPYHTPDSHSWISFFPQEFKGNQVDCLVTVDASKLKADKNYEREIVLNSNARQEKYYLKVKVKTEPIQLNISFPPYWLIAGFGLVVASISLWLTPEAIWWTMAFGNKFILILAAIKGVIVKSRFWAVFGLIFGAYSGAYSGKIFDIVFASEIFGTILGTILGVLFGAFLGAICGARGGFEGAILGGVDGGFIGLIIMSFGMMINNALKPIYEATNKILEKNFYSRGINRKVTALYIFLAGGTGIFAGVAAAIDFNPYLFTGLTAFALSLGGMLIYPALKLRRLKALYRRQESDNLIES